MPDWVQQIHRQLAGLNLAPAREAEIVEELAQHAGERYQELQDSGMPEAEARRVTLEELAGHESLAEELRGTERLNAPEPPVPGVPGKGRFLADLWPDVRYGFRTLRRNPGFTAVVVLTLALGIAVNTATFAIVNAVLLRPLPGPNGDRIVLMSNLYPKGGVVHQTTSSASHYFQRLRALTTLDQQAMFRQGKLTLELDGVPQQVKGMAVTPSFFRLIGIAPVRGRAFTEAEGAPGSDRKVILSHALWQQISGGNPAVLGRDLRLSGTPYSIVGVMPPDFAFVDPEVRLWVPLAFSAQEKSQPHNNSWSHIGRLKPGATVAQLQAQVNALNAAELERLPEWKETLVNMGFWTKAEPLQSMLVGDVEGALHLLWGGAVFVLLIVVLNIANLTLARWSVRSKEMATRLALGAGRGRLARQSIVENGMLAGGGGAAGILLGAAILDGIARLGLDRFPRASEVRIDATVVLVVFGLAAAVGVLAGLVPIAGALRVSLSGTLRDAGRTGTSNSRTRRLRQSLVAAEFALAFVLLAGAGLLLASFRNLLAVDPGFVSKGVVTASTSAPGSRYRGGAELRALLNRSLDSIRRLPGVAAAGATTAIPFGDDTTSSVIQAEGHVMDAGESVLSPRRLSVTPGYFETMKIGLVRGRYFEDRDDDRAAPVVIVDEKLARHFWPDRDPIGQRMYRPRSPKDLAKIDADTRFYRVVGVVRSVRLEDLAGMRGTSGAYYFPYAQEDSRDFTFAVRTAGDTGSVMREVRAAMARIDPELALFDVKNMSERAALSVSSRRTSMMLATGFGGVALCLSAIGIYGVLAYLVAQRRREIAIRMALGSTGAAAVRLVLRDGLVLVTIGLAMGLAGAAGLRKAIAGLIYGVQPLDPLVIGSVAVLLAATALAACAVPARRAARVNPVTLLAQE